MLEWMIEQGADINLRDKQGITPLHIWYANENIALALIKNGADVNAQDKNGNTPFHRGLGLSVKIISHMISAGADLNILYDKSSAEDTVTVIDNSKWREFRILHPCQNLRQYRFQFQPFQHCFQHLSFPVRRPHPFEVSAVYKHRIPVATNPKIQRKCLCRKSC